MICRSSGIISAIVRPDLYWNQKNGVISPRTVTTRPTRESTQAIEPSSPRTECSSRCHSFMIPETGYANASSTRGTSLQARESGRLP